MTRKKDRTLRYQKIFGVRRKKRKSTQSQIENIRLQKEPIDDVDMVDSEKNTQASSTLTYDNVGDDGLSDDTVIYQWDNVRKRIIHSSSEEENVHVSNPYDAKSSTCASKMSYFLNVTSKNPRTELFGEHVTIPIYRIIDLNMLNVILNEVKCPKCRNYGISIGDYPAKRKGLAVKLLLSCENKKCNFSATTFSSQKVYRGLNESDDDEDDDENNKDNNDSNNTIDDVPTTSTATTDVTATPSFAAFETAEHNLNVKDGIGGDIIYDKTRNNEGSSSEVNDEETEEHTIDEDTVKKSRKIRKISESSNLPFDINWRAILAFRSFGCNHANIVRMCTYMNMNKPMSQTSYAKSAREIAKRMKWLRQEVLNANAEIIRARYIEDDPDLLNETVIDIDVSFDNSWHKRGYTSHYGLGAVIDLKTKLPIDFDILSTYCKGCQIKDRIADKESSSYKKWVLKHKKHCQRNYQGSAKSMEQQIAVFMWKRSIKLYNFRYTTFLGDQDSSTFSKLESENIYGDNHPIIKLNCVGHVVKSFGTALRSTSKKHHLGGKGRLTKTLTERMQQWYSKAIYKNKGDLSSMREAVWAIYFHMISTDDVPNHSFCPEEKDTWCSFNLATYENKLPRPHTLYFDEEVKDKVYDVIKKFSDEQFLTRCLEVETQNTNESLHGAIWRRLPKITFVSKTQIEIGVTMAISEYIRGRSAIVNQLQILGLPHNFDTVVAIEAMDKLRLRMAAQKSSIAFKKRRIFLKKEKNKKEKKTLLKEGTTYRHDMGVNSSTDEDDDDNSANDEHEFTDIGEQDDENENENDYDDIETTYEDD